MSTSEEPTTGEDPARPSTVSLDEATLEAIIEGVVRRMKPGESTGTPVTSGTDMLEGEGGS